MEWRHFSLGIWQNPQIFWDLHLYFTFSIDNRQDTALSCRGAPLRAATGQFGKLGQSLGQLSTTRIYDDKALYDCGSEQWGIARVVLCFHYLCVGGIIVTPGSGGLVLLAPEMQGRKHYSLLFTIVASSQLWMILWPAQYSWKLCSEKTFCIFF